MTRILVVAAHPDDEVLGAGATIHNMAKNGHDTFALILSTASPTRESELLERCMESHKIIGVTESEFASLRCMAFDKEEHHKVVLKIEDAIIRYRPDVVITHHPSDIHPDHRTLAKCVLEAAMLPQRQTRQDASQISRLMFMEVPSSTDWNFDPSHGKFDPNAFHEVEKDDLDAKIKAVEVYNEVIREAPHPRSREGLEARAVIRGCMFGTRYAEAFQQSFGRAFS